MFNDAEAKSHPGWRATISNIVLAFFSFLLLHIIERVIIVWFVFPKLNSHGAHVVRCAALSIFINKPIKNIRLM